MITGIESKWLVKDKRGDKLSFSPRYHKDKFGKLLAESNDLTSLLNYFISYNWFHSLLPLLSTMKDVEINDKCIECYREINDAVCDLSNIKRFYCESPVGMCIYPSVELSIIEPGAYIPPHLDRSDKICSIMIYLPSHSQECHPNLGTTFWLTKGKSSFKPRNYEYSQYRFLEGEEILELNKNSIQYKTQFQGTGAVLFCSNQRSWHSIEYPKSLRIGPRVSININYYMS